jgi:hypothetical protein
MDLALLLQSSGDGGASAVGIFRFFAGFFIIISLHSSFLGFTYWISKDE